MFYVWASGQYADTLVREIKAQRLFDVETSQRMFPDFQDGSFASEFKLGFYGYLSLLTNRSM